VKSSVLGSVLFYTYENIFDITKNKISNFSSSMFQASNKILDLNKENPTIYSNSKSDGDDISIDVDDNKSNEKNKFVNSESIKIVDTNLNRIMDESGNSFVCVLTAAVGVGAFGGMTICI
jgi:hypothetical protein